MISVVLLAAGQPPRESLARVIARIKDAGAAVILAGMTDVERTHADLGIDVVRSVSRHVVTDPELYRVGRTALPSQRVWMHMQRDQVLVERCRLANVLVALDPAAVYSVWELGRRFPHLLLRQGAVAGYHALVEHVPEQPTPVPLPRTANASPSLPRRALRDAARALLRSNMALSAPARTLWPALLSSSRLSSARRVRVGVDLITRLHAAGRPRAASRLSDALVARLDRNRDRADLLGEIAVRLIDHGEIPPALRQAVAAELALADELLASGDGACAAASLMQARRIAFDQGVHLSHTTSPLADDPAGFTEPLRSSSAVAAIARPQGRREPAAPLPQDRPVQVAIATHGNTNFVRQLEMHLREDPRFEVRSVGLADLGRLARLVRDPWRMFSSLLKANKSAERMAERHLRELLDWADVVFIDWCTALVRVVNLADPGTARIVVRLHSYEAFTVWPHLLDVSRIDDFVFVSDHVRDLVVAQVPGLVGPHGPRIRVVPNAVDLGRFAREKPDAARFTIGLIGYHVVAKDPRWALEVMRHVRAKDPRYRLRLIGQPFNDGFSRAAAAYGEAFERELALLEAEGAVDRYGYTDDLPTALEQVGVILCSSVREGSPVALLEATASGAVPVVRDWPLFRSMKHGPRTMYPVDWVVDTPDQAANRIIGATEELATWRRMSAEASAVALARWDLAVTGDEYRALLLDD